MQINVTDAIIFAEKTGNWQRSGLNEIKAAGRLSRRGNEIELIGDYSPTDNGLAFMVVKLRKTP